ncbi:helix-turn-helix domain-containing protein [Lentilactobacillus diolivorans]|uniref:helix-turn-helix domain-containing protein n=1 Tax=Lentilactobacillus diolivorans TaxID=179838 RepID=UPI002468498C|nr:helix-turn-helix transcriptional regulator [Lentilactobacillus diolivorans]MDH5105558.1 helix-turn-helix domain-containing protein [Lentilactobacillus diolivorans]
MTFAKRFKEIRRRSGLTQAQLSDKSGVPQTTISGIENGGKIPNYFNARKLAEALGIDMNDFAEKEVIK